MFWSIFYSTLILGSFSQAQALLPAQFLELSQGIYSFSTSRVTKAKLILHVSGYDPAHPLDEVLALQAKGYICKDFPAGGLELRGFNCVSENINELPVEIIAFIQAEVAGGSISVLERMNHCQFPNQASCADPTGQNAAKVFQKYEVQLPSEINSFSWYLSAQNTADLQKNSIPNAAYINIPIPFDWGRDLYREFYLYRRETNWKALWLRIISRHLKPPEPFKPGIYWATYQVEIEVDLQSPTQKTRKDNL